MPSARRLGLRKLRIRPDLISPKFGELTVFHFEAPRPEELGHGGLTEAELVAAACKLAEHKFHSFRPLNADHLAAQLNYVFGWICEPTDKPQFSLHFSCHANRDGLAVGTSTLNWSEIATLLETASAGSGLKYMLVISGCGDGPAPALARAFSRLGTPPAYIFTFENEVSWQDAAHASSLIYRFLPAVSVMDKKRVQKIVDDVRGLGFGSLVYFRWAKGEFKRYPSRQA